MSNIKLNILEMNELETSNLILGDWTITLSGDSSSLLFAKSNVNQFEIAANIVSGCTDSNYVEFFDCVHGFCKPGYRVKDESEVTINHHAPFPIPTELTDVYKWIMKGKIWEDTDFQKVNALMEYDDLATQRILTDIHKHLID